jgi:hypothetical protein
VQFRYIAAMQRIRVVVILFLGVVVFAFGLGVGFVAPRLARLGFGEKVFNNVTVLQQVKTISQLVTVQYVLEKVVVLEDVKWYGDNRVLLLAHGIVKAGVDLGQLQPEDVQIHGPKITVRLPPARVTDAYLADKQTQVIERSTGLLRLFDKDLEQTARQSAVDDISRAARTSGIVKDAEERARAQLTLLFQQMGFKEIKFETR